MLYDRSSALIALSSSTKIADVLGVRRMEEHNLVSEVGALDRNKWFEEPPTKVFVVVEGRLNKGRAFTVEG